MEDKIKINPALKRIHPDFWELIEEIQNEKVVQKFDKVSNKTPKYIITKQIYNLFNVNPKIKQMVIEVQRSKNGN